MKKLLTFLLTVLTTLCYAQVNVQINMPNPVDANTSNWTNGFVVTATTQKTYERCCLILTIKGPVNCGSLTPQTASTFTFEANKPKVFNGQNAIALFGTNCVLTPGSYTLYATVYINGTPQAPPASRQFEIKKEEPAAQVNLSINMPNPVDASTSNWTNGFVITATTQKSVEQCCLILTIKGPVNCGTLSPPTAPNFILRANEPKVFSGQNAIALFGTNCVLAPGSYTLYATVYINGKPQTPPASRPFEIRKEEPANYQPPQAIAPANGSVIKEADAKKPVTFRWTPVTPKPREEVTYKLRIFEVKQGQTATAVVKSAAPMLEKEVKNQTQFVLPSLSQLNASKGSSFAWTVQAVGPKGNPVGGNNGMSGVMLFSVTSFDCNYSFNIRATDSICKGMINGLNKYHICFNSNYSSSNIDLTFSNSNSGLKVYMPISPYTQYSISNVSPLITQSMNVGLTVKNYCFDVLVPPGTTTLRIGLQGDDKDLDPNNICQPGATYDIKLPPCVCTACDSVRINIPEMIKITLDSESTVLGSDLTLSLQTLDISVTPGGIKSIKTQLVYFEYKPETDDCIPCNRDSRNWGNFIGGTFSDNEFPLNGVLLNGHELQWTNTNINGATVNGKFYYHISLPPILFCCKLDIKFCIRYIFEFTDCSVCDKVVCYSYVKTK